MRSWLYRILAALALTALLLCLAATAMLGWEDRLARAGRRESTETAIRLAPGDARNYTTLASFGGADRSLALESAVIASPYNAQAWIALGLNAEVEGDRIRAERSLLQAARVDRTYAPRWSLASFYFRASSRAQCLLWLRQAARMSYGDPRPLAQLAWNLAGDAPEALAAVSERPPVLESYASLLLDHGRLGPAEVAAGRLLDIAGKDAAGAALVYGDRFVDAGRLEAALRLWNRLAAAGWIPARPLDPERGPHLTNGDFAREPLGRGFDWQMQGVAGVEMVRQPAAGSLRLSFSGEQPESCMLMLQRVALAPGRAWRLRFEYRSQGMARDTGLRWRTTRAEWPAPASEAWSEAAFDFRTPAGGVSVPLVLAYERAPGTMRMAGSFWLRRLRLEAR
jgi:tetratricopeptide (TPR) repeat protein